MSPRVQGTPIPHPKTAYPAQSRYAPPMPGNDVAPHIDPPPPPPSPVALALLARSALSEKQQPLKIYAFDYTVTGLPLALPEVSPQVQELLSVVLLAWVAALFAERIQIGISWRFSPPKWLGRCVFYFYPPSANAKAYAILF